MRLTTMSEKPVYVAEVMIAVHKTYSLTHIIGTKNAPLKPDLESLRAMHYKPFVERETQTTRLKKVK